MDKINLTVNNSEGKEIVLRVGEAEKITYPKAINITGILGAPFQFLSGKVIDPKRSHIQIKKDTGVIKLLILDTDPHSTCEITGQLKKDGYFENWQINSEKRWTVQQFLKHIKMHKSFFSTGSDCDDLVSSFHKWNAKIETVIKEHNDQAGNSLSMLEKKVSQVELKTKFSLTIPIFQGYQKQTFNVEIGLEPKQNAVELYLYSNDLFSLEIEHREALIEAELSKFDDFPCSKVILS
jgi:hypothetical protein